MNRLNNIRGSVSSMTYVLTATVALVMLGGFFVANAEEALVTQLAFTTSEQTFETNTESEVFQVQVQNVLGESEVASSTTLILASNSETGEFSNGSFSGGTCSGDWEAGPRSLPLSEGTSNKAFCYRDSTAGPHTLTVSAEGKGWTPAEQVVEVTEAASITIEGGDSYDTLEDAINTAEDGDTILISGTVGDGDNYTAYEITEPITIQGESGAEIYGSFIIKTDGVTVDGLKMYTRGGGNGPLKTAIDVIAKSVTITNNVFELPNPEALAAEGGVGNGVTVWPNGEGEANYDISDNTFNSFSADVPNWSSSALQVVEGLDLARFDMSGTISGVVDLDPETEKALAAGNTYNGSTNNYVHSNWTDGVIYKYVLASNSDQLESIAYTGEGATILFGDNITLSSQLTVDKPLIIDGNGFTLNASFDKTDNTNNTAIGIIGADNVVIKDLTIDGVGGSLWPLQLHGINAYESTNIILEDVSILNFGGAALNVNGSTVTATNLNTEGNEWGSVNVDPGSDVTIPSVFTLSSGELAEDLQIWSDGANVTEEATVTVNAVGYDVYTVGGTAHGLIWANKELTNVAFVTGEPTVVYTSIQDAIDSTEPGDTVEVKSGTYEENIVIEHGIELIGEGSEVTTITPETGRVIDIRAQVANIENLLIEGFTLRAGDASLVLQSNSQANDGYDGINYTYRDLVVDSSGYEQTAIGLFDVDTILLDNVVVKNSTRSSGGAIEAIGVKDMTITNSSVIDNVVGIKILSVPGYEANSNTSIRNSIISGNSDVGLVNDDLVLSVDARNNYWGDASGPDHSSNEDGEGDEITDGIDFKPWYSNEDLTELRSTSTVNGEGNNDVVIEEEVTSSTESGNVTLTIEDNTTITGPAGWNGNIILPTEVSAEGDTPTGFTVGSTVIRVGSDDEVLLLSQPAKLVLEGVTGVVGYRSAGSDNWTQITTICANVDNNPTNITPHGECYITDGGDTVIWTYHFTDFGSLVAVNIGGGGGSVNTSSNNNDDDEDEVTEEETEEQIEENNAPQGQVLGAETGYMFLFDLNIGMSGEAVVELQERLRSEGFFTFHTSTGYFGPITQNAVIAYQSHYGIAPAVGYVGPITRAHLNENAQAQTSTQASIQDQINVLLAQVQALTAILEARSN